MRDPFDAMAAIKGGFVVTGSVSPGANGNPPFFFDKNGRFQSIEWL